MAYEICRDILGPQRVPGAQPGDSITAADLERLSQEAQDAAVVSGQQAQALFVGALLAVEEAEENGGWHVLPDVISMLASPSSWLRGDLSNSSQGWLSAAVTGAMKAVNSTAAAAINSTAVDLMLLSCTMPDKPLDVAKVGIKIDLPMLGAMCYK
jgi:hypothetical protein